ncbi:MAG: hypothetical protein K6T80_07545 [Firmicutes bacterium]|nr:hypothetical protein [Bacillota bacterium]
MKRSTRKALKDEKGYAYVIAFLLMSAVLLAAMEGAASNAQVVQTADVNLSDAVSVAVKAAATQVSPASQASGTPRLRAAYAHAAFRDTLAGNIGLDTNTLASLPGLPYTRGAYWLLVYNGYDDFSCDGAPGAKLFYFDGVAATESGFPYAGFPARFALSGGGIASGAGGDRTARLDSPGVVALVELESRKVIGRGTVTYRRWAAARVVNR